MATGLAWYFEKMVVCCAAFFIAYTLAHSCPTEAADDEVMALLDFEWCKRSVLVYPCFLGGEVASRFSSFTT